MLHFKAILKVKSQVIFLLLLSFYGLGCEKLGLTGDLGSSSQSSRLFLSSESSGMGILYASENLLVGQSLIIYPKYEDPESGEYLNVGSSFTILSGNNIAEFISLQEGKQLVLRSLQPGTMRARFEYQGETTLFNLTVSTSTPVVQRYRSLGFSSTTALAQGSGNKLTIDNNGLASFESALPDTVGVGDVLQYDCNMNDTGYDLDSNDCLAFIHQRNSSTEFQLYSVDGKLPSALLLSDEDWSLFRSYTSLVDSANGDENTGIDSDLRNFDTWIGGRDLVSNQEQWHLALYADNPLDSGATFTIPWIASSSFYLKLFTPYLPSEVGISQRHNGSWDATKTHLISALSFGPAALNIVDIDTVYFEGLQMEASGGNQRKCLRLVGASNVYISHNIMRRTAPSATPSYPMIVGGTNSTNIFNNLIYGFAEEKAIYHVSSSATENIMIYNNTLVGNDVGIHVNSSTPNAIARNNISVNNTTMDYNTNIDSSSNNISSDATSPDGAGFQNLTVTFTNAGSEDYSLDGTDTAALDQGADLSSDPNLSFDTDLLNNSRSAPWSIGAFE